jgi:predicted phage terminase large subunit-like protein
VAKSVQLDLRLHPAQIEVFNNPARFRVVAAGRRFGKSHNAMVEAICAALDPRNDRKKAVFIIAPVFPQAKQIYWRALLQMAYPVIKHVNTNEGIVTVTNDVPIYIKGADRPDSLRGVGLYFAVLDEFATMKPQVWEEIVRPALADVTGRALFIGTPAGRNHFYTLFQLGLEGGDPEWKSFHFPSTANQFLPPGAVDAARRTMSSSSFRQEFLASFETGGAENFKREWFRYDEIEPKEGEWYVAVDLAGFADETNTARSVLAKRDQTAISVVKVLPSGKWWVKDVILGRWGIKETARRIIDAVQSAQPVAWGIEKGSLYNAVVPDLVALGAERNMAVRPVALSHDNKSKTDRIMWALQGRLEHGNVVFRPAPWNAEIEDQLLHFPSRMVPDDGIESLAYINQLAGPYSFTGYDPNNDTPYWQPADAAVGF